MSVVDRQEWDVVVVGAGGAGLRAAVEARERGARTAVICKSLFGKAHTVMAEGGIAAAMANANPHDNWQVHFRDTMRGGKFLNQWRMAELHAQEAPQRVWELETWGALFDRTKEGKISQRNFGGHEYPRLAHVGDRTGLELIRTLQQKIVSLQQEDHRETGDYESRLKVFQECTVTRILKDGSRVSGVFAYDRETGRFFVLEAPGRGDRDRRHRQVLQGDVELVGVHRRRPRPGPARGRTPAEHGVRAVPPDRHGLATVGEGHPRHRVGPR
ncbi:succinate dehydrogenase/fumarate reductase flavoprotein subunit [Streptomyces sp. SAI-041]|nr:succinate dehydrogenase/fumarate reductase flavoprotein subunit [Streptomyces sp. SAI-041]